METTVHSIDLNVPVSTAYEQWTRFEDFPQFMEGVEEVRRLDATRLYWVANIGGTRKEWEAQITEEVPNERLGWRSEAGEFTAGLVTFQPLAAERTRVTVRFNYEPQGVMETIGDWLGLVSRRVEGDLERFKQFVETRSRASAGTRSSGATPERTPIHPPQPATTAAGADPRFEAYEADFRAHATTAFASRGQAYEHWVPAYRYGYALATDPAYRGRDWATIEPEALRQWEARHQGAWDEFKEAVHYAWQHLRGRHEHGETEVRIPVVAEELQVGTRQVEHGGVRLQSRLTETPVEAEVRLREERVIVERHPVNRPATNADLTAFKEGTIELTETAEEAVVSKQVRVVEEVIVSKEVTERTETVRGAVRRTEVEAEPIGAERAPETHRFDRYEAEFRTHYHTTLASRGDAYDHWAPAYRYGYDLARDRRNASRDWAVIEPEARRRWEERHQGTWETFKDTIRYAWDTVRGRREARP